MPVRVIVASYLGFIRDSTRRRSAAIYWLYRVGSGLIVSAPLTQVLSGQTARLRGGDSELFAPGAVVLLDVLHQTATALETTQRHTSFAAIIALVLGLLPLTAVQLALNEHPNANTPRSVMGALPWMLLMGIIRLVVVVAACLAGLLLASMVAGAMIGWTSELTTSLFALGAALPFVSLALLSGPTVDLARCRIARALSGGERLDLRKLLQAWSLALGWLIRHPLRVTASWALPALAAASLGALAALWLPLLAGQSGLLNGLGVVLLGQLTCVVVTALRLGWLSRAARLSATLQREDETFSS